jgi:hypothetical protein
MSDQTGTSIVVVAKPATAPLASRPITIELGTTTPDQAPTAEHDKLYTKVLPVPYKTLITLPTVMTSSVLCLP